MLQPRPQVSFYNQLHKQKKSEKFFKVFYDRMRLAQQEIRATVSVNMFELSSRKRDDDGEIGSVRYKKGALKAVEPVHTTRTSPDLLHRVEGLQTVNQLPGPKPKRRQVA